MYRVQTEQHAVVGRTSSSAARNGVSPYLQKLPHSNFLQVALPRPTSEQRRQRRRRRSISNDRTRDRLLDSAYQPGNVDHLDLSYFLANSNHSFSRPTSAPTRTYDFMKIFNTIQDFMYINMTVCILVKLHQQRKNAHEQLFIKHLLKVKGLL